MAYQITAKSNEGPIANLTCPRRKVNYNLNLIAHSFAFQFASYYAANGCVDPDVAKWAESVQVTVKKHGVQILNKPLLNMFYDAGAGNEIAL